MAVFGNSRLVQFVAVALLGSLVGLAHAQSPMVRWERIQGIDPSATGRVVQGINPVTAPWSTTRGSALLNTENGRIQFQVEGLSIGSSPTPLALIGTTGVVTMIKGTIICHEPGGDVVDTEPVELSPEGDALFTGELSEIPSCAPDKLVFLLRIAEVREGAPPITNLWLAHGAVRKIR